ncbi:MAG: polysaccharide deacetylase family protein [Victivallaceae bacterium]|nr:polysaccharide deacetylase family protein [Victivallaceae bacterium]
MNRYGKIILGGILIGSLATAAEKLDLSDVKHGVLALTFDDRNFDGWEKAIPLFEKYHAHASFFVMGKIDAPAVSAMKKLKESGHTVGLHTVHHADAPAVFQKDGAEHFLEKEILPQLKACEKAGIKVSALAYPENRHNAETDARLGEYFEHFRAGKKDAPHGVSGVPVTEIPSIRVVGGQGIGAYYHTDPAEVEKAVRLAAEKNLFIAFYSHNIAQKPNNISISFELLETILKTASECGMKIVGLDELPVAAK